ncbi:MAG: HTTM domain-containing protein [Bacteroidota bacterium]|nr:HTTM domain-containing protein [Bacteroidota bacterium]
MYFKNIKYVQDNYESNISLVIFRICFSIVLIVQTIYFFKLGFIENNILKPFILFPFFDFLNNPSEQLVYLSAILMLISNIGMIFNKTSRISCLIFFLAFTYLWLLDRGYFNNHYYFISIITFLLFFLNKKSSFKKNYYVPKINIIAFQIMIFLIYFISGINKINPYWIFDLQPMTHILQTKAQVSGNNLFSNNIIISFFTFSGLIYDLVIGFFLIFKRTRILGFIFVLIFNSLNFFLFKDVGEIGVFPFLMISTLVLFIDPVKFQKLLNVKKIEKVILPNKSFVNPLIVFFIIVQLLLPFRHVLVKGNVDYNGVGQRFAWRMKIMYKESKIDFFLKNKLTGDKYNVDVTKMLTPIQYNNLKYYPDLILPLAYKMKSHAISEFGIKFPEVTCVFKTSFMGKKEQLLFSPKKDLTLIPINSKASNWIFELEK